MSKPKTQEQLDRTTDQRLKKKYGVGLDWYNCQLRLQEGGCYICGSTPKTRSLHIDHDHSYTKVKIAAVKIGKTWGATAVYRGVAYGEVGTKRNQVVAAIKHRLKIASVRGLLCFPHNAGLRKFSDNPIWLEKAAEYLYQHAPSVVDQYCDNCDGTGWTEGGPYLQNTCPKCEGSGTLTREGT